MRWKVMLAIAVSAMVFGGIGNVLRVYLPEQRAKLLERVLIEEHEQCSEVDPMIILAIIGAETGFKNVVGDEGKAVGYMQLHRESVWYVGAFYPEIHTWYRRLHSHKELLKYPAMQIRIGYRYMCLLTRNCGGNVLCAIRRYNGGEKYLEYVLKWLEKVLKIAVTKL